MLPKSSRDYFIQDRVAMHLLPADWLSEKSLTNIENGRNLPSIVTLKALSAALEVDFIDLIKEIEPYLY
ncbi:XRE family transcriptional regulator [Lactobacillus sp. XV13L]|nr:XRE family transcriptional regulator [Lactobacillus sp. XV13L]